MRDEMRECPLCQGEQTVLVPTVVAAGYKIRLCDGVVIDGSRLVSISPTRCQVCEGAGFIGS